MLIPIIYQNDEIFIINKPAGLAVQGGEKITHSLDKDFAEQVGSKVYLVHRLDKETAGLWLLQNRLQLQKNGHDLFLQKLCVRNILPFAVEDWLKKVV